jgi:hypothetical protein
LRAFASRRLEFPRLTPELVGWSSSLGFEFRSHVAHLGSARANIGALATPATSDKIGYDGGAVVGGLGMKDLQAALGSGGAIGIGGNDNGN